uniref:CSON004016 protein n=1 Tax=Culicoides sonorensis TaxID=179676 RepID=A0A336LY16_CULSO
MPVPRKIKRNGHYTYQHSSPPKVLNINSNDKDKDDLEALVIKPSSIRIWIHEKDIKKLTKVLWEGQGMRLCRETSTNKKVKSFLDAVPYVMATIKDVHTAAINNDLDLLEAASADPVPPVMLGCKDANGLTPLHKAAGLGHLECLEYILMKYPNAATIEDNTGKTALHWASAKNNFRAFNLLVQAGADEIANDHQMRHPAYYRSKPNEVDKTLLHVIPEAPRVPRKPPSFDWSMFFNADDANNNEPALVQSILSSRINNDNGNTNNIRKAKSTDPIRQNNEDEDESEEPVKIASFSMEHIVDKTFEELESESMRSRKNSESQNETNDLIEKSSESNHILDDEIPNGNHLENLELEPELEKKVDELVDEALNENNLNNNNDSNSEHGDKDLVENVEDENKIDHNNDEQEENDDDDQATGNEVSNIEDNVAEVVEPGEHQSTTEDAEYADDENESDTARNNTENEVQNEIETDDVPTPTHTEKESNAEVLVINSDEAEHEKDDVSTSSSPSPEMEISGVVQGDPDNDQVESQGDPKFEDDEDIKKLIENGDMEKLAGLVLNGYGHKLDGFTSDHPEIQSFLDNVPAYMEKIKKVHIAARDGNLRDLQAALDRRKFATARDKVSPYGGTPLHVATIFGHAGIVRYLAGRFSETLEAKDEHGRTPIHYAAVIKDNGHFYNLLLHLGADPNEGHNAEFYTKHDQSDKILSHKQLLRDYGADESLADDMLLDQVPDDVHSARRLLEDPEQIQTLERCFNLIHEINLREEGEIELPSNSVPGSASSIRISVTSYLARFLTKNIFDRIKRRQTRLDHNLFDLIWPAMKKSARETPVDQELNAGIVVPDFDAYVVFQEFLVPLIKDMHCLDPNQSFTPQPEHMFMPDEFIEENTNDGDFHLILDRQGVFMAEGVIECCRNLENFELPLNLNLGQLEQAERTLTGKILSMEFTHAIGETELGVYYTMNEVFESHTLNDRLQSLGVLIPLLNPDISVQQPESIAINNQFWPYGRGVYVSHDEDLVAWINAQEHLRVLCTTKRGNITDIGAAYMKISRAMSYLEEILEFRHSYFLGNLSSRPAFLGTAMKINVLLALPYLSKERANLRHLCSVRGLSMKFEVNDTLIRLSNMQSLGITEWRIFQDFCTAIANILQLERDLSTSTTSQITESFNRLLRRKKSGYAV